MALIKGKNVSTNITKNLKDQIYDKSVDIEERKTLGATLEDIKTDISSNASNIEAIQNNIGTISGEINDINVKLTGIDLTDISNNISTLQGNYNSLSGDVSNVQGSISTLQGQYTSLDTDISTIRGSISTNNNAISNLQSAIGNVGDKSLATQIAEIIANMPENTPGTGPSLSGYLKDLAYDQINLPINDGHYRIKSVVDLDKIVVSLDRSLASDMPDDFYYTIYNDGNYEIDFYIHYKTHRPTLEMYPNTDSYDSEIDFYYDDENGWYKYDEDNNVILVQEPVYIDYKRTHTCDKSDEYTFDLSQIIEFPEIKTKDRVLKDVPLKDFTYNNEIKYELSNPNTISFTHLIDHPFKLSEDELSLLESDVYEEDTNRITRYPIFDVSEEDYNYLMNNPTCKQFLTQVSYIVKEEIYPEGTLKSEYLTITIGHRDDEEDPQFITYTQDHSYENDSPNMFFELQTSYITRKEMYTAEDFLDIYNMSITSDFEYLNDTCKFELKDHELDDILSVYAYDFYENSIINKSIFRKVMTPCDYSGDLTYVKTDYEINEPNIMMYKVPFKSEINLDNINLEELDEAFVKEGISDMEAIEALASNTYHLSTPNVTKLLSIANMHGWEEDFDGKTCNLFGILSIQKPVISTEGESEFAVIINILNLFGKEISLNENSDIVQISIHKNNNASYTYMTGEDINSYLDFMIGYQAVMQLFQNGSDDMKSYIASTIQGGSDAPSQDLINEFNSVYNEMDSMRAAFKVNEWLTYDEEVDLSFTLMGLPLSLESQDDLNEVVNIMKAVSEDFAADCPSGDGGVYTLLDINLDIILNIKLYVSDPQRYIVINEGQVAVLLNQAMSETAQLPANKFVNPQSGLAYPKLEIFIADNMFNNETYVKDHDKAKAFLMKLLASELSCDELLEIPAYPEVVTMFDTTTLEDVISNMKDNTPVGEKVYSEYPWREDLDMNDIAEKLKTYQNGLYEFNGGFSNRNGYSYQIYSAVFNSNPGTSISSISIGITGPVSTTATGSTDPYCGYIQVYRTGGAPLYKFIPGAYGMGPNPTSYDPTKWYNGNSYNEATQSEIETLCFNNDALTNPILPETINTNPDINNPGLFRLLGFDKLTKTLKEEIDDIKSNMNSLNPSVLEEIDNKLEENSRVIAEITENIKAVGNVDDLFISEKKYNSLGLKMKGTFVSLSPTPNVKKFCDNAGTRWEYFKTENPVYILPSKFGASSSSTRLQKSIIRTFNNYTDENGVTANIILIVNDYTSSRTGSSIGYIPSYCYVTYSIISDQNVTLKDFVILDDKIVVESWGKPKETHPLYIYQEGSSTITLEANTWYHGETNYNPLINKLTKIPSVNANNLKDYLDSYFAANSDIDSKLFYTCMNKYATGYSLGNIVAQKYNINDVDGYLMAMVTSQYTYFYLLGYDSIGIQNGWYSSTDPDYIANSDEYRVDNAYVPYIFDRQVDTNGSIDEAYYVGHLDNAFSSIINFNEITTRGEFVYQSDYLNKNTLTSTSAIGYGSIYYNEEPDIAMKENLLNLYAHDDTGYYYGFKYKLLDNVDFNRMKESLSNVDYDYPRSTYLNNSEFDNYVADGWFTTSNTVYNSETGKYDTRYDYYIQMLNDSPYWCNKYTGGYTIYDSDASMSVVNPIMDVAILHTLYYKSGNGWAELPGNIFSYRFAFDQTIHTGNSSASYSSTVNITLLMASTRMTFNPGDYIYIGRGYNYRNSYLYIAKGQPYTIEPGIWYAYVDGGNYFDLDSTYNMLDFENSYIMPLKELIPIWNEKLASLELPLDELIENITIGNSYNRSTSTYFNKYIGKYILNGDITDVYTPKQYIDFKTSKGVDIEVNPDDTSAVMTGLKINGVAYSIAGGSGGSSSVTLVKNTEIKSFNWYDNTDYLDNFSTFAYCADISSMSFYTAQTVSVTFGNSEAMSGLYSETCLLDTTNGKVIIFANEKKDITIPVITTYGNVSNVETEGSNIPLGSPTDTPDMKTYYGLLALINSK